MADGLMTEEMSTALRERLALIAARALALAEAAVERAEPWLKHLGEPPTDASARQRWLHEVRTVAAYRDRYRVDGRGALGEHRTEAHKLDAARAVQAIRRARAISEGTANKDWRGRAIDAQERAIG